MNCCNNYQNCNCNTGNLSENNDKLKRELGDFVDLLRERVNDIAYDKNYENILNSIADVKLDLNNAIDESLDIVNTAKDEVEAVVAAIPFEDGVLADTFVDVAGSLSQRTLNKGLESVADLSTINNPKDGLRVYVKSYHTGLGIGGGYYYFDSEMAGINKNPVCFNGWVKEEKDNFYVEDAGVIPDYISEEDQSEKLQELFHNIPEGSTVTANNKYVINNHVDIFKRLNVKGSGTFYATEFNKPPYGFVNEGLITVRGSNNPTKLTNLNGKVSRGARSFTVEDASNINKDDIIHLVSDKLIYNGSRAYSFKFQLIKVDKVVGNTITTHGSVEHTFEDTETVEIFKHTYITGFRWEGVSVINNLRDTTDWFLQGLSFYYVAESVVEGGYYEAGSRSSLSLNNSFSCKVTGVIARNKFIEEAVGLNYGLVTNGCSDVLIESSSFYSDRTAIDLGESVQIHAKNCFIYGGAATHAGASQSFESCIIHGGSYMRGLRNSVINCIYYDDRIEDNSLAGTIVTAEAAAWGGFKAVNNRIYITNPLNKKMNALSINATDHTDVFEPCIITNNIIEVTGKGEDIYGINLLTNKLSDTQNTVLITGNVIKTPNTAIALRQIKNVVISNNIIEFTGSLEGTNTRQSVVSVWHASSDTIGTENLMLHDNIVVFSPGDITTRTYLLNATLGGMTEEDKNRMYKKISVKNNVCSADISKTYMYTGNPLEFTFTGNISDTFTKDVVAGVTDYIKTGTTNNRPIDVPIGYQYFDTTLNNPVYWTGSDWVDSTGTEV